MRLLVKTAHFQFINSSLKLCEVFSALEVFFSHNALYKSTYYITLHYITYHCNRLTLRLFCTVGFTKMFSEFTRIQIWLQISCSC